MALVEISYVDLLGQMITFETVCLLGRRKPDDGSRMEEAICKIIDLEAEINQDMMKLVELKKDIIRRIKAVDSAELQTILELR